MNKIDGVSNTFLTINYLNLSKNFSSKKTEDKINIRKVWDVVINPTKYDNQINELLKNKNFSRVFFKILDEEGSIHQNNLIAAASENVLKRSTEEFKLEIIPSNKDKKIFYLLLTILKDFKLPLLNLYVICNNISLCKKIPSFKEKQAQMILKKDDEFFKLITKPESEIFIR